MEKKYELPEENLENNMLRDPAVDYGIQEEIKVLPLTEEDVNDCITGDELMEAVFAHIDELFDRKK